MLNTLIRIEACIVTILAVFFLQEAGFAQDLAQRPESISIVTYYPSPYGSYNQLNVGGGGLRLARVIEKVPANSWTDIDITSLPAGGLYIISVIPADKDPFLTYMIMFSAEQKDVGLTVFPGVIADASPAPTPEYKEYPLQPGKTQRLDDPKRELVNSGELKEWLRKRKLAQFRAQTSSDSVSFVLQIKTTKECSVRIGKILSYWADQNQ